jgi:uncharacterized LabA/DUF88 family protein
MDRTAFFVDAGYLFAAGSLLIANEHLSRGELYLDYDAVLELFAKLTEQITGLPLLRIYWYDGTATGPTPQQLALAYRPNVKLRLGFVNQQGQQKGVDSLIVTDLINLARNRAMADAILLTGDEDIRVGVQQAQEFGVRVHLLGIAPSKNNQSGLLVQEADTVHELTADKVQTFLKRAPSGATSPSSAGAIPSNAVHSATAMTLEDVAQRIANELLPEEMAAVLKDSDGGSVSPHIDRRLLVAGAQATGVEKLTSEQKRRMRTAFLDACRRLTTK